MRNTHTEMCGHRQPAVEGVGMEETDTVQNEMARESGKRVLQRCGAWGRPRARRKIQGQKIKALA